MKDKDFLLWVHERLQAFGDNRSYDFMHKLKAIADGTPEDRDTNWNPRIMECRCGGQPGLHEVGSSSCYREKVTRPPRLISGSDDRWFVDGHTITGFTLRQQRGYRLHPCGNWSRPKDYESTNSLPDET